MNDGNYCLHAEPEEGATTPQSVTGDAEGAVSDSVPATAMGDTDSKEFVLPHSTSVPNKAAWKLPPTKQNKGRLPVPDHTHFCVTEGRQKRGLMPTLAQQYKAILGQFVISFHTPLLLSHLPAHTRSCQQHQHFTVVKHRQRGNSRWCTSKLPVGASSSGHFHHPNKMEEGKDEDSHTHSTSKHYRQYSPQRKSCLHCNQGKGYGKLVQHSNSSDGWWTYLWNCARAALFHTINWTADVRWWSWYILNKLHNC